MPEKIIIIGGGIVGLATAYQLSRLKPDASITVLEKESAVGQHQSGHNSGVLHSGIYYKPGSLKATNCRAGKALMERFCQEEGIAYDICGKVIVATREDELATLQTIFERGVANGVRCEMIGPERLRELEPHAAGIKAIHVPEAGIVSYPQVCRKLADKLSVAGHSVVLNSRVESIRSGAEFVVSTSQGEFTGTHLINCAGLHSDQMARLAGEQIDIQIVPFRGEYFELTPDGAALCRNLIYPVPDPNFPFLGVHYTRMIGGGVECGPNAVLALAREGYSWGKINMAELAQSLTFRGFQRFAAKHWRAGLGEMWRSLSRAAFLRALQRLIPEVQDQHLLPAHAGVRAQALSAAGKLVDDFAIHVEAGGRALHILNAPSPAATASLNIGATLAKQLIG